MIKAVKIPLWVTPFKRVFASRAALAILTEIGLTKAKQLEPYLPRLSQHGLSTCPTEKGLALLTSAELPLFKPETLYRWDGGEEEEALLPEKEPPKNIFKQKLEVIDYVNAGKLGLVGFLEADQAGRLFKKVWTIFHNQLIFQAHGRRHYINSLEECGMIFGVIVQETIRNKDAPVKRLYGWNDERNWGDVEHANITYDLARKGAKGWKILPVPEPVDSLAPIQESKRANTLMLKFLLNSQNDNKYNRSWIIREGLNPRISYKFRGKTYELFGFKAGEKIKTVISEEFNEGLGRKEKIARFFRAGHRLAGVYVLSYRDRTRWDLCHPPIVIKAVGEQSAARLRSGKIKQFLLQALPEESKLEINGLQVYAGGCVHLKFDRTVYPVYVGRQWEKQVVFCRLSQVAGEKVAHFWLNEENYRGGKPSLAAEGKTIAIKEGTQWVMKQGQRKSSDPGRKVSVAI